MTIPSAPGWYADPPGTSTLRWWDGTRWQREPGSIEQPPLPAGTTTGTWAIWVMSLLPLLGPPILLLQDPLAQLRPSLHQLSTTLHEAGTTSQVHVVTMPVLFTPPMLLSQAVSLVLVAAQVLLAVADRRALEHRGVVRPFHWAWSLLQPTYVIGRAVVVRRRTGHGLAPLWVWIATEAVALGFTAWFIAQTIEAVGAALR